MALPPGLVESLPPELLELLPPGWETEMDTEQLRLIDAALEKMEARLYHSSNSADSEYGQYWGHPDKFANEILGLTWTPEQQEIGDAIARYLTSYKG